MSFSKSPSQLYSLAANVAEGADRHAEIEVDGKAVHLVAFARGPDQAARALALIRYVSGWKATQIFVGGRLAQHPHGVTQVLDCYLEASACDDRTAHCEKVVDDPYDTQLDRETGGITMRSEARLRLVSSLRSGRLPEDWHPGYLEGGVRVGRRRIGASPHHALGVRP